MAERVPIQLDEDLEFKERNTPPGPRKGRGSALKWLLPVLAALGIYAMFFDGGGSDGILREPTPDQIVVAEEITVTVKDHIEEHGIPEDPAELDLPEGTDIMISPDGSWIASTPDGQLISSPGGLTPR
jgi:hypothetical protein